MSSIILRVGMPGIACVTILFSIFVLFRGHNEPGGGFIGGLLGASAFALYSMTEGVEATKRAMGLPAITYAGIGLVIGGLAGFLSLPAGEAFMTGLWYIPEFDDSFKLIATPVLFDIGVYLVVVGTITALVLELEGN